ncbi:MAG: hypothetical protein KME47_01685 [Nodosilinea sp. WJT8-NPBG4]|jgi:hypothetical protein|nr:hypothetical protein [Nodosilinea sp. WJT8-NPBG4]
MHDGALHRQAYAIFSSSQGDRSDFDALKNLALQAQGEEQEMIDWLIEGWIAVLCTAMLQAKDWSWADETAPE